MSCMDKIPTAMSALGVELQNVVREFVAEEFAAVQRQIKEEFARLERELRAQHERSMSALAEARRREQRADFVHVECSDAPRPAGDGRPEGKICLEVGGERFSTTSEVLRGSGHPDPSTWDSYLALLCNGRWQPSLFVARSPVSFNYILEYLTYYTLYNHPKDTATLALLISDADFYGLRDLHASLSFSVNSWRGAGGDDGERQYRHCHGSTGLRTVSAQGTKITVEHPGVYFICVRDLQTSNCGARKLDLLRDDRPLAKSYMYSCNGSVCTQIACLAHLTTRTTLSVRSDAPDEEPSCSSLSMLRLDGRFLYAAWRFNSGRFQYLSHHPCTACTAHSDADTSEAVVVERTGKYLVVAQALQSIATERNLRLSVNNEEVASSYVNTGRYDRSACATAFLMQLVSLSEGDTLTLGCDDAVEDDNNNFFLVKLPDGASCATWQAQTSHSLGMHVLEWNTPLFEHEDYDIEERNTRVRLKHHGFYLVSVRAVMHANNRKMLQLCQNSSVVATSYVTTDGTHRNSGHIAEVVNALAGDLLSVSCLDVADVGKQTCANFSIVMLTKTAGI